MVRIRVTEERGSLKSKQKLFNEAGQKAVREAKRQGLAVTFVRNCEIIRQHADKREEVIGTVPPRVPVTTRKIKLQKIKLP